MKPGWTQDGRLLNLGSRVLGAVLGVALLEGSSRERVASLVKLLKPQFPPADLVRIGGARDGGYLVPSDIDNYDLLISPGVGETYEFDRYFFSRGIDAVLVDASVDLPAEPHMVHLKKFVAGYSSEADHLVSLADLLEQHGAGRSRIVLQMDIEGAEYEVLAATPDSVLGRFGVIAMEAHHLGGLCYRGMLPIIETAFRRLLKNHFVAHIHVNNSGRVIPYGDIEVPDTLELTFVHRALYRATRNAGFASPHPLDVPSVATLPDAPVPRCWW
jgi:hypothetical protein